jgi:hypothetical protein
MDHNIETGDKMNTKRDSFPFISKEGVFFVVGGKEKQNNQIILSKGELQRLKRKLNEIDIDKFFWKQVI